MTSQSAPQLVTGRLSAIAASLILLSLGVSGSAAAYETKAPTAQYYVSSPSAYAVTPQHDTAAARQRAATLARSEIGLSGKILNNAELHSELAFIDYFRDVEVALDRFPLETFSSHDMMTLATSLALARASFEGSAQAFSSWVALARASGLTSGDLRVPDRFVVHDSAGIDPDSPDRSDIDALFELDCIAEI